MALPDGMDTVLTATAAVVYTELRNLAEDLTLPEEEYPLARILEIEDTRTCPLCREVNGMVIRRGTAEWERWRKPSHINCRRAFSYIPRDAKDDDGKPILPDFREPPPDIIAKHGHFILDPNKYEPLRVPAYADTRQFVVRTRKVGYKRYALLEWLVTPSPADALRGLPDIGPAPKVRRARTAAEARQQLLALGRYKDHVRQTIEDYFQKLDVLRATAQTSEEQALVRNRTREAVTAMTAELGKLSHLQIQVLQSSNKGNITIILDPALPDNLKPIVSQAINILNMWSPLQMQVQVKYDPNTTRAYARRGEIILTPQSTLRTALHELGHVLEFSNPRNLQAALNVYDSRTANEALVSLASLFPNSGYMQNEMTRVDRFPSAYMGKDYGRRATEIISIGLEMMYDDAAALARDHPDIFDVVFNALRGLN